MSPSRLSSWLLLGGIFTGFFGAVWHGHRASAYSKPDHFKRFHQLISPDASYYPPYSMLETLALTRWQPGQTLVIIGGNSILNGVGQPVDGVWSQRLQEMLGLDYVVVNLAFRAAYPTQAGALVAESLLARGLPVIYVANTNPAAATGRAPGGASGYFYWQALAQHRLTPHAARTDSIQRWLDSLPPAERRQQDEERLGGMIEAWFRPQSLWHHVGYRYFFTVWNPLLDTDFWAPRHRLADNEPAARPLAERFQDHLPEEMAIVRSYSAAMAVSGPEGRWELEAGNRDRLNRDIDASIVPALRPRTLILLTQQSAYYRNRLTRSERNRNDTVYAACARIWRDQGIACEIVGEDFLSADFIDRSHLSATGGLKLAWFVAAKIKKIDHP